MKSTKTPRHAPGGRFVRSFIALLAAGALAACGTPARAPGEGSPLADGFEPQIGQLGKDSVWVPTPNRLIERMLQMADTTAADVVMDLGSGDGRIPVIAAKRFGARGIGIELDENLVRYASALAEREGVGARATFEREDLFATDLTRATVITMYISPHVTARLRPKLLGMAPGTRITSHQFTLGDWEPDETAKVESATAYLWVVPARVAGNWTVRSGNAVYQVTFNQNHQHLGGTVRFAGKGGTLLAARVRGNAVRFTFLDEGGDSRTFNGTIDGPSMRGSSRTSQPGSPVRTWSAVRD